MEDKLAGSFNSDDFGKLKNNMSFLVVRLVKIVCPWKKYGPAN